jgi:transposase
MRERTNIRLSRADRSKLEAVVADRNSPQKHVWRAKIVLLTAAGRGTAEIMQATGKAKTMIWRWQERFRDEGAAGLWRDKTRRSRIPPLSPEVAARVVALTLAGPPPAASHWTGSAMAKAAGISVSSVQRIWRAHGLQPHRVRQFKLSNDPQFAAKLHEIVGLYVDPPDHAMVLSVDEKSQIQALDRTQPGLPMKKGRAGTMTHDYERHGVEVEHCRPAGTVGRNRASESGLDVMRIGDALAVTTRRPGEPGEIEIERELGCNVASVEGLCLGVPDRTERAVVEDAPGHTEIEFGSNRQNVHYHLEAFGASISLLPLAPRRASRRLLHPLITVQSFGLFQSVRSRVS